MVPRTNLAALRGMGYGRMRRWTDEHCDVAVSSAMLPEGYDGYYDERERSIVIDWRLTYSQKRCAFVHELVHWSHGDCTCKGWLGRKCERRTRRETARILIGMTEYETAENLYDGDVSHIAECLDVTGDVVRDYQNLVLSVAMLR
ncbi:MAG: hypothetical protein J6575_03725 [Bifidobacterium sp.]|nr:hypothetical protein [Bifidobacterium sp.]